jgi:hypothetical protein
LGACHSRKLTLVAASNPGVLILPRRESTYEVIFRELDDSRPVWHGPRVFLTL